jgi:hypothetical protein
MVARKAVQEGTMTHPTHTEIEAVAEGLTEAQRHSLKLLCFANGRLSLSAFPNIPGSLIEGRTEGGLFRQAYPSLLGQQVRDHIMKEDG